MQVPTNMMPMNQPGRAPIATRPPIMNVRSAFEQNAAPSLPGHFVTTEDEIVPGNVPMDGSISYFPTKDLSKIYIRQWNRLGDLEHLTYVLEQPELPAPPEPTPPEPAAQVPSNEPSREETILVQTLTSLNQGLAVSFTNLGKTLESIQHSISDMNERMDKLSENNEWNMDGMG